jgi:hypothetical protein
MTNNSVIIYKGKNFVKLIKNPTQNKVIVFDLDETLGSFGDLYILWQILQPFILSFSDPYIIFKELINIYPEFLRPGIIPILEYIYNKKQIGICSNIFLYTNNQCSSDWIGYIIKFFEESMPNLFDKVIYAFKIGGKRFEPLRTTNNKTYNDIIICALLPKNSELCFVDNSYHSKMINENVYYIQPYSYHHSLSGKEVMIRFLTQWTCFPLPNDFEHLLNIFNNRPANKSIDTEKISYKFMYNLKQYFQLSIKTNKTRTTKIGWQLGQFTRKKRC